MEAQRYPEDYDGIIAGAPANYWTHLMAGFLWNSQATVGDAKAYIPARKLAALQAATLAACDALDGVKDDVIDDPTRCKFDPAKMLCPGEETDACLTSSQIDALRKIYSGPRTSAGKTLFPGYLAGGEAGPGGWSAWITGAAPKGSLQYMFGTQCFANMVADNAAWDYKTFDVDAGTRAADAKIGPILNAINPDLSRFRARGGKLILYHGWSDAAIAPVNATDYYRSAVAKAGEKKAETFLRLFMIPGMQHCGGGPGPDVFGQFGAAKGDADHDLGRALERWVEEGVAPDRIIATKFDASKPPVPIRTRPVCRYPQVAQWKQSGSTDDAANFTCAPAVANNAGN
jgi:feruloyl esterase